MLFIPLSPLTEWILCYQRIHYDHKLEFAKDAPSAFCLSWLYEAQGRVLYYLILYSRGYCFVNPEMALDIFTFAHMEVRSTALIMTKQGTCLGKKTLIKVWIL